MNIVEYLCPNHCGRKYKHKGNLQRHLKFECGVPTKFQCTICGKCFARKDTFKSHMGLKHRIVL